VYLPQLDVNHTWVYWFNETSVGSGGARISMDTPIDEFPLFYIQPIPPVQPATMANITAFWSQQRQDQVLCLTSKCYGANAPGDSGAYVTLSVEGVGVSSLGAAGASLVINGASYPLVPLNLAYSAVHMENWVGTNSTYPDASYSAPGSTDWSNGYVLSVQAPGSLPLNVWSKAYANHTDWATFASATGNAWAQTNGYTLQYVTGYVLPA
jgi:hypothetical protein